MRGRVRPRDGGARASTNRRASPSRTPTTQWDAIVALGRSRSTPICSASDVRLTMGGEPTFVSVDDRDGAEWNTAALGPTKRAARRRAAAGGCEARYGAERLRALRPGQVVSGRAAAALGARCYWRADGEPAWTRSRAVRRRARARRPRRAPTPSASSARSPRRLGVDRRARASPATKTSGTTCGASAGCRSTSIRSTRGSTTSWSATRLRRVFTQGSTRSSATRCRSSGAADATALAHRARGSCATSGCT